MSSDEQVSLVKDFSTNEESDIELNDKENTDSVNINTKNNNLLMNNNQQQHHHLMTFDEYNKKMSVNSKFDDDFYDSEEEEDDDEDLDDDNEEDEGEVGGVRGVGNGAKGGDVKLDNDSIFSDEEYDDDEDEEVEKNKKPIDREEDNADQATRKGSFDDDDEEDEEYEGGGVGRKNKIHYLLNRKPINHKLRNSDSIKTISTPQGKVRILYETAPSGSANSAASGGDTFQKDTNPKQVNEVTQKVAPVLINGTVALLYRGESSISDVNINNSKYMPITSIMNFNFNPNPPNPPQQTNNKDNNVLTKFNTYEGDDDDGDTDDDTALDYVDKKDESFKETPTVAPIKVTSEDTTVVVLNKQPDDDKNDNSVIPIIDRPLSEVLGIKKNQFTLFRIADTTTKTTTAPSITANDETTTIDSNAVDDVSNYDYEEGLTEDGNDYRDGKMRTRARTTTEISVKHELVNLAIIPAFDSELERSTKYYEKNYRNRGNHMNDLSAVHCVMQAMVAIAAMATVFGILGAYFKTRILDQIMIMHW